MNPAQPNVPNAKDARFWALEQAYADSLAIQENTQKQIDALLKGYQHLEKRGHYSPPHCPAGVRRTTGRLPPTYHRKIIWIFI